MVDRIARCQTLPQSSNNVWQSASVREHETLAQRVAGPIGQNLPGILQRAKLDIGLLAPAEILTLQRTIGNQAVARLRTSAGQQRTALPPRTLPAKPPIGPPDDIYEKEADPLA